MDPWLHEKDYFITMAETVRVKILEKDWASEVSDGKAE